MVGVAEGARRERAAVLMADVQRYSLHLARDEAGTYDRLGRAVARFRALVGDYGGRFVNAVGDSALATFPRAADAVAFAVAFQEDMAREELWHAGELPLRFRIGIHVAEVTVTGGDVVGLGVNLAHRLQRLAAPGGVCVSDEVRRELADQPDLAWRTLGWRRLHNIDGPVFAYAVGRERDAAAFDAQAAPTPAPTPEVADGASLAVLPLDPLSDEPADRHFANGVTADLIHSLTRFRDLSVIARESAFQFRDRGTDARTVARCLGVRYLFCGSIQRLGRRLRLRCELVEAEGGRCLWSDRIETALDEVFAVQDDITDTIASRLAIHVTTAERARLGTRPVPELSAYGLVLRGEELYLKYRREAVLHARRLLEQASELDPRYGRTSAALSRTYNFDWRYAWSPEPALALDRALDLALESVDKDAFDARGHAELGYAHLYRKAHDASIAAYERAVGLNPNDADILADFGDALVYDGQPERAVAVLQRAMRLNPYYPDTYLWHLADAY
ncbi:MAG TPA: adenylate/guanylate cyclase domain-containing protein, partial [Geminicoccaceae bacterium]